MLLTIGKVLDETGLEKATEMLAQVDWQDGTATAGATASKVKRNEQAIMNEGVGQELRQFLFDAIQHHPVMKSATRPNRWTNVMVSKTRDGGGYGMHMDNAHMGGGTQWMRTDLSFTLFLSNPNDYEGGELVIQQPGGVQSLKLNRGDLVVYPSSSLHQVSDVTSGERVVCIGWIESRLRDAAQRELLFDLENLRTELRKTLDRQSAELLTLDKTISNLLRMWSET